METIKTIFAGITIDATITLLTILTIFTINIIILIDRLNFNRRIIKKLYHPFW
ncbi:MAG: hypothetical protein V3V84_00805 [Candidatus Bathyarchaeia archaeon]